MTDMISLFNGGSSECHEADFAILRFFQRFSNEFSSVNTRNQSIALRFKVGSLVQTARGLFTIYHVASYRV